MKHSEPLVTTQTQGEWEISVSAPESAFLPRQANQITGNKLVKMVNFTLCYFTISF